MSEQPDLFDAPRARRTDPLSSHAAADKAERDGTIGRQAREALRLVREFPGRTSKELSRLSGMDRYALARRLPELERHGYVKRTEEGAKEVQWWARD